MPVTASSGELLRLVSQVGIARRSSTLRMWKSSYCDTIRTLACWSMLCLTSGRIAVLPTLLWHRLRHGLFAVPLDHDSPHEERRQHSSDDLLSSSALGRGSAVRREFR